MKITLLFPPHWAPYQPYLSLPSLTGVLREKGYEVIQRDVNIEWVDHFLSTSGLKNCHKRIKHRTEDLNKREEKSEEINLELRQLTQWKDIYQNLIRLTKGAKDLLRDNKKFFDFRLYQESCLLLLKAYHFIGDAYYPTILDFYALDQKYSRYSTRGIIEAVNDRDGNLYIDYFEKYTIPSLKENPSDFYGISISAFSQTIPGITLAKLIKEAFPDIHICLGGNVFTRVGKRLMPSSPLFDFFDSIILYEGEIALVKLLKAIEMGAEFSEVPNIIYKNKDKLIFNENYEQADINSLPPPDYEGLPFEKYIAPFPVFPILSARGCYWNKCAFCQHKYTYRGAYRPRKIEKVIDDLEIMNKKYGGKYFSFNDEAIPSSRLEKIAGEIIARNLDIRWEAYGKIDSGFTYELGKLLYTAGCRMLSFGLESSSPRVLQLMNKGLDIASFEKVLSFSSEAGIWNYVWFFTGFPSETEEEARNTADFILKNQKNIHSVSLNCTFTLEEYTDIVQNPHKYYLDKVKSLEGFDLSFVYDYSVKSGLSPDKAREVARDLNDRIILEHKQGLIMCTMPRVHQMLYADHFKTNDLSGHINSLY